MYNGGGYDGPWRAYGQAEAKGCDEMAVYVKDENPVIQGAIRDETFPCSRIPLHEKN